MTRRTSYETSAHRRRADPVEWEIDGKTIHLKASVDIIELSGPLDVLGEAIPEGANELRVIGERRDTLRRMMKEIFVEPDSHKTYDELAPDLDFETLTKMIHDLVEEYTGQNPTQEQPSSDNSNETGLTLTDGAPLEDSTLPLSPLIEP